LNIDPASVTEATAAPKPETEPRHPAFPVLADLLFDRDRDLRLAAVVAFGYLQERNAVTLLNAAVQDTDLNVRLAARQALADIQ